MVLYNSPQNINVFFLLCALFVFFSSIYQVIITYNLLQNGGDGSLMTETLIGIPLSLNIFALVIFLLMFIMGLVKMLCNKAKYRDYVFTLVFTIFIVLYLSVCAIPIDVAILNGGTLSTTFVEFCYVITVAIIVISAFASILYICAICKNDGLDDIDRRLRLYEKDDMFKQTVSQNVGKPAETTFGLKNSSQLQEICSTPFFPGTARAALADNDFSKDACGALGLAPDQAL